MQDSGTMVRVGIVSAVKKDERQARCFFPDMGDMVSDWLYVLQHPTRTESVALTTDTSDGHRHSVPSHDHQSGLWMPEVNDRVLVLYPDGYNMDGYVLGAIP